MAFTGSPKAKAGCMPAWMKGNMGACFGVPWYVGACFGCFLCGGNRAQKPERPTVPKKRSHDFSKQLDARSMRSAVGVLYIPEPFEHSEILHIRPCEKRCVLFVVLLRAYYFFMLFFWSITRKRPKRNTHPASQQHPQSPPPPLPLTSTLADSSSTPSQQPPPSAALLPSVFPRDRGGPTHLSTVFVAAGLGTGSNPHGDSAAVRRVAHVRRAIQLHRSGRVAAHRVARGA